MTTMQINGSTVEFNKHGFMSDFDSWSKDVAMAIADEQGVELTDCHWEVINFMREFYSEFETPPSPKRIIEACGKKITGSIKCMNKDLKSLFPGNGCKSACMIAGLPRHYCNAC